MKIEASFDGNQKEFIEDICWIVYSTMHGVKRQKPGYFFRAYPLHDPRERQSLQVAEEIFELLTGDRPDYEADEEGDEEGDEGANNPQ